MKIKFFCVFSVIVVLLSGFCSALEYPDISAEAALVMDPDLEEVLYEKNADQRMFPASTTKIMTALLAIEKGDLDAEVTVSEDALHGLYEMGSSVNFKVGEILTVRQLLECLLIASANDAANILAEHVAGSQSAFVDMMNKRASELGCSDTHFANPHGLHDEDHYTTARSLYIIARKAMEYPIFSELVSMQLFTLPPTNKCQTERMFYTTNNLISPWRSRDYMYDKAIGIKTGFTTPAGNCLVSAAVDGDRTYYCVVLGCRPSEEDPNKTMSFVDSKELLEWAFKSYETKTILSENEPIKEIPVELAQDKDFVVLMPQYSVARLVPIDVSGEDFEREIHVEENVEAPVEKGQELGYMTLSLNGREYGSVPLVAADDVERSQVLYTLSRISAFFSGTLFKVILGAACALIVIIVVYVIFARRRTRRRRRGYTGRRR